MSASAFVEKPTPKKSSRYANRYRLNVEGDSGQRTRNQADMGAVGESLASSLVGFDDPQDTRVDFYLAVVSRCSDGVEAADRDNAFMAVMKFEMRNGMV